MADNVYNIGSFINQTSIEIKRAERYRVFVALILFDFSFLDNLDGNQKSSILDAMVELTQLSVRGSDIVSRVNGSVALLIPETPRQGAEITGRRLTDLMRAKLTELSGRDVEETIQLEMASYPDTAGAKTLPEILQELTEKSRN